MATAVAPKKKFTKYNIVSTKLSAKVLVNGKKKSADADPSFSILKISISAINGFGRALNSFNSQINSLSETVSKSAKLQEKIDKRWSVENLRTAKLKSEELKRKKKLASDEKNSSRRKKDAETESKSEKGDSLGLKSKTKEKISKPVVSFFDTIKNFIQFFIKYVVITSVLKWMSDPKNTEKLGKTFIGLRKIFKFLWDIVSAVGGILTGGLVNLGSGIFDTVDGLRKGNVGQIFNGFGQLLQALPGLMLLRWVLNPMSLINDVSRILSMIGFGDKPDVPKPTEKPRKPPSARRVGATRRLIRRKFSSATRRASEFLNKARSGLGDKFTKGMNWAGGKLSNAGKKLNKAGDWISGQYKRMSKYGDSLKKGAVDKLKGAGEVIKKKAGEISEPLLKRAKQILDEKGITKLAQKIGDQAMGLIKKMPGYNKIAAKIAKEGGEGMLKKLGGKAIPIIGGLVNLFFAFDRLKRGDKTGAILEAISGILDIAGVVTGGSTSVASMIIDGYLFGRDFFPDMIKKENQTFDAIMDFLNPLKAVQKLLPTVPKFEKGGIVGADGKQVDANKVGGVLTDTTFQTLNNLGPGGATASRLLGGELSELKSSFGPSNILISDSKLKTPSIKKNKDITNKLLGGDSSNINDLIGEKKPNISEGKVSGDTSVVGLFASVVGVLGALVNKDFKIGGDSSGSPSGEGDDSASNGNSPDVGEIKGGPMHQKGANVAKKLMSLLNIKDYQAAAIVGNVIQESSLVPDRIQGSGMKRGPLKLDGVTGYSYPQWTSIDRQRNFAKYMESKGFDWKRKGATDEMATGFLAQEFKGYMSSVFKNTKDVGTASNWVLFNYEKPADQGKREQSERATDAKAVLDKMATGGLVSDWNRRFAPRQSAFSFKEATQPTESNKKFAGGGKFKNGQLPESELESIGSGHKLHKSVAPQFRALQAAAKKDGFPFGSALKINSSYRSYQRQKELYNQLGPGTAAYPGTSNHGLGLAVDLWYTDKAYKWLRKNANVFGFGQIPGYATDNPNGHEAWHWENVSRKGSVDGGAPTSSGDSSDPSSTSESQSSAPTPWYQSLQDAFSGKTAAQLLGVSTPESSTETPSTPTETTEKKAGGGKVNLTPMQQWAQKYPQLAAKVKPGQSGYEEIQSYLNAKKYSNISNTAFKLSSQGTDLSGLKPATTSSSTNASTVIKKSPTLPEESLYTKNKLLILNNFRTKVVSSPGPQIVLSGSVPQACYSSFFNN